MSLFAKLFGINSETKEDPAKRKEYKLKDIPLNHLNMEGEEELFEMVLKNDYEGMKFKSLELYNKADDAYLETELEEALNLMYATMKNFEACQMMWYYHNQILALHYGDSPEQFDVQLFSTVPFEFPESRLYHGEVIPSEGMRIPFVTFYEELAASMVPLETRFVYNIIPRPKQ